MPSSCAERKVKIRKCVRGFPGGKHSSWGKALSLSLKQLHPAVSTSAGREQNTAESYFPYLNIRALPIADIIWTTNMVSRPLMPRSHPSTQPDLGHRSISQFKSGKHRHSTATYIAHFLSHPQKTPTDQTMSVVYELFRTWPGAVRTDHPHSSMAAWGSNRDQVTSTHQLEERFGDSSPLGVLYELNAQVLFLGTTYDTNTCFHLAEYRRPDPPTKEFLIVQGRGQDRRLMTYRDVDTDSSIFRDIGEDFEAEQAIKIGKIGAATCRLFSLRSAVDFATVWLAKRNR